jgi:hypothetical protein
MARNRGGGGAAPLSPDDAFTLLGNEARIAILRALWDAYDPHEADGTVSFSDLFDRVDVDDSGNFNYHLGRLTGHFVRRTADGYRLAAPGFRVVRAVVAGGVTGDPTVGPSPVDADCPLCGSPAEITHGDGTTWARCTACEGYWPLRGGEIFGFSLPPAGLRGRDADGVLDATIAYSIHRFEAMCDGVCPECGSAVDSSLAVCADHDADGSVCDACDSRFAAVLTFACTACKFDWRSPSYAAVSHHPALVAFYFDRGVEHVPATWDGLRRGLDWREEVLTTDPPAVRVTAAHGRDRIAFVVDAAGSVASVTERSVSQQ